MVSHGNFSLHICTCMSLAVVTSNILYVLIGYWDIFFYLFLRIYLFMRERKRERQRETEEERRETLADSMLSAETDVGLNFTTLRS